MFCCYVRVSGLACTQVIRAQQLPHRIRPYIIACTANVTDDYRHKCLLAGMDRFMSDKPRLSRGGHAGVQAGHIEHLMLVCALIATFGSIYGCVGVVCTGPSPSCWRSCLVTWKSATQRKLKHCLSCSNPSARCASTSEARDRGNGCGRRFDRK